MQRAWVRTVLLSIFLIILLSTLSLAKPKFVLPPGVHTITVNSQHFEIVTEVTIEIVFDFVDEVRVTGTVTVLDQVGSGWVKITWLEYSAVILDEIVEGSTDFEYSSSETGHAERKNSPKYGPMMRANPQ